MFVHRHRWIIGMVSSFLLVAGLAGCGASQQARATPIPTIAYLPPTVVPDTATPTPPPTATPTQPPRSGPTPVPPKPSPTPNIPQPEGGVPNISGQLILVSIDQQWLWAYQNRQLVFNTPVTTGRPELPTPDGKYSVLNKLTNIIFYSAWPPSSPYYYPPEHVNYALYFLSGGYYLHDAPWRHVFGPGTELPQTNPDGTVTPGSHGCVEVPTSAGAWIYRWASIGATIDIYGTTPAPVPTPTPIPPTPTMVPPTPTATPIADVMTTITGNSAQRQ